MKQSAIAAREMGFKGKAVIHPSQIQVVNEVFTPSKENLEWAKRILEAWESANKEGRGAFRMDGRMVDVVHLKMAQNLLKRAELLGLS